MISAITKNILDKKSKCVVTVKIIVANLYVRHNILHEREVNLLDEIGHYAKICRFLKVTGRYLQIEKNFARLVKIKSKNPAQNPAEDYQIILTKYILERVLSIP
ncbi:MAG: hypothetical protein M3367_12455 [Acidobacteriota bacterium]|nr:hypothetical protein [Acidobacteriota bacterium]